MPPRRSSEDARSYKTVRTMLPGQPLMGGRSRLNQSEILLPQTLERRFPDNADRMPPVDFGAMTRTSDSAAPAAIARRRPSAFAIAMAVVAILALAGWAIGHKTASGLQRWCRNDVHLGDAFGAVSLPSKGLISVSDGTWTYDGGVTVQFVDGQVYTKTCG